MIYYILIYYIYILYFSGRNSSNRKYLEREVYGLLIQQLYHLNELMIVIMMFSNCLLNEAVFILSFEPNYSFSFCSTGCGFDTRRGRNYNLRLNWGWTRRSDWLCSKGLTVAAKPGTNQLCANQKRRPVYHWHTHTHSASVLRVHGQTSAHTHCSSFSLNR